MGKTLSYDLVVRTKGRPPSWVPSFMRSMFIWNESKRVKGAIPVNTPEFGKSIPVLGGQINLRVSSGCLVATAIYAGLNIPLVGYCLPDGPLSVKGSASGFSVDGMIALATTYEESALEILVG